MQDCSITYKDKLCYDYLVSLKLPNLLYRGRMGMIMACSIMRGLKSISFDRLFIVMIYINQI